MESKQVLGYCLDWYAPRLPNVEAVRTMTDRQLVADNPWAVAMVRHARETEALRWYHERYLKDHLGGYGVQNLRLVRGEGPLYRALLHGPKDLEWCRDRVSEGFKFEPYHWKDGQVLWDFAEQLGGDHTVVATRERVAQRYGDKGFLRDTGRALGRVEDFAPHTLAWTLNDLKQETKRMLCECGSVRVVFDGQGASGDGASVFTAPFDEGRFDVEAKKWCRYRDASAPMFVERWFAKEDVLSLSCTWRVEDAEPKFVGFNRQLEGSTRQGTLAHKGSFTSSQPAQVIPRSWQHRHGWDDERTAATVHEIISALRTHYMSQMAREGWNGPACFDLILLSSGRWFISECNDRNFGSRPGSDLLKQELSRLGVNANRCVSLFNIEDLPVAHISAWVGALAGPNWLDFIDDYGDLSRPEGRAPWCMLMLPRASMESGKLIGLVSASDPEEAELVQHAVVDRVRRAARFYFGSPLIQAK